MTEYISREEAIKELREAYENEYPTASGDFDEYASHDVPNVLRNIPSADVQPVNQWISVKDRLPNDGERVLIYVPKTQNKYYVAAFYTLRDEIKFAMNIYGMSYCWYAEDVAYWQPLPEPPKDGDTK